MQLLLDMRGVWCKRESRHIFVGRGSGMRGVRPVGMLYVAERSRCVPLARPPRSAPDRREGGLLMSPGWRMVLTRLAERSKTSNVQSWRGDCSVNVF